MSKTIRISPLCGRRYLRRPLFGDWLVGLSEMFFSLAFE
jgi:hypothetical protein